MELTSGHTVARAQEITQLTQIPQGGPCGPLAAWPQILDQSHALSLVSGMTLRIELVPAIWLELSGSIMGALNGHMPPCGLGAEVAGVQRVEAERNGVKIKAHLTTAHHFQ